MKVFISYSHTDEALANTVVASLEKAGLSAWYDKREIIPGENWAAKIAAGLRESDAMVVLLTPHALQSTSVRHDIEYALSEKRFDKRLIPVVVGDRGDFMPNQIPWIFNRMRTIKLPKHGRNQEHFNQIVEALKEVA